MKPTTRVLIALGCAAVSAWSLFAGELVVRPSVAASAATQADCRQAEADASRAGPLSTPARDAALESVLGELAQLRSRVSALEGQAVRIEQESESDSSKPAALPGRQQYLAELARSFDAEREDPSWADRARARIRELAQRAPSLSEALRSIDCRTQRCRVELTHEDNDELVAATSKLSDSLVSVLPMADYELQERGNGERLMVVYFSRSPSDDVTRAPAP